MVLRDSLTRKREWCVQRQNQLFATNPVVLALKNFTLLTNIRFMRGQLINVFLIITILICPMRSWSGSSCAACGPSEASCITKTCCCSSTKSDQRPSQPAKPSKPAGEKCSCNCLCGGAILPVVFEVELDLQWQFVFASPLIAKATSDRTLAVGCRGPGQLTLRSPANLGRAMRQWYSSFAI